MKVLIDTEDLRSGEEFTPALMSMIDDANVFQLFWSERSAQSDFVRKEWMHALTLNKGRGFIRPVRWERPLAPAPPELAALKIHFKYIPLPSVDEGDAPPTRESDDQVRSALPTPPAQDALVASASPSVAGLQAAANASTEAALNVNPQDAAASSDLGSSDGQTNRAPSSKKRIPHRRWPWSKK